RRRASAAWRCRRPLRTRRGSSAAGSPPPRGARRRPWARCSPTAAPQRRRKRPTAPISACPCSALRSPVLRPSPAQGSRARRAPGPRRNASIRPECPRPLPHSGDVTAAFDSPPRLAVRTVELRDRRGLLTHLPAAAPLCWLRSGEGLVGWGQAARIELPAEEDPRGTSRFTEGARRLAELFAEAAVDDPVDLPGTGPVAFGAFTFDPRSSGSALVVPSVVVGRRDGRTWLTTIGGHRVGAHPAELSAPRTPLRPVGPLTWGEGALPAEAWGGAVAEAVRRIRGGALRKAVLARDLVADAERGIDPRTLLDRLAGG